MTSKEDQAKILLMQQNLAALRGHAGWTAQRLADEIGVSKQTISNIETGKSSLTKTQYLAMRTVFNFEALERNNVRLAQALHDLGMNPRRRRPNHCRETSMTSPIKKQANPQADG